MKRLVLLIIALSSLYIAPATAQSPGVSATAGVENLKITDVAIYPNPAKNELNIAFDPAFGARTVAVYNLIGKAIITAKVYGNSIKMDIEDIPVGIYFLRVIDAQGRVLTTRK